MNGAPTSIHDQLKRNSISPRKSSKESSNIFREHKRPRFTIPKPATSISRTSPSATTNESKSPPVQISRCPPFSLPCTNATPSLGSSQNPATLNVLRRPRFSLSDHSRTYDDGIENHASGTPPSPSLSSFSATPSGHNPFIVTEELEDPHLSSMSHFCRSRRFVVPSRSRRGLRPGEGGEIKASDLLSRIVQATPKNKLDGAGPLVPSADWSPHRPRRWAQTSIGHGSGTISGTGWERDKFVPGGMAETLALWIYEEQCRQR